FFFQAEDGIRDFHVTGVQTCALPISDLDLAPLVLPDVLLVGVPQRQPDDARLVASLEGGAEAVGAFLLRRLAVGLCDVAPIQVRSEERRVGAECSCWEGRGAGEKRSE